MRRRHGFSWQSSPSVGSSCGRVSGFPTSRKVAVMGLRPRSQVPLFEKSFKYRLKSTTQKSLTEIDPSRKSAAARENLFLEADSSQRTSRENVTSAVTEPTLGGQIGRAHV